MSALIGQLIGRVGDDRPNREARRPLHQEIDTVFGIRAAIVDQIGGVYPVASRPQDSDDATGAAGRLPNGVRQAFGPQ